MLSSASGVFCWPRGGEGDISAQLIEFWIVSYTPSNPLLPGRTFFCAHRQMHKAALQDVGGFMGEYLYVRRSVGLCVCPYPLSTSRPTGPQLSLQVHRFGADPTVHRLDIVKSQMQVCPVSCPPRPLPPVRPPSLFPLPLSFSLVLSPSPFLSLSLSSPPPPSLSPLLPLSLFLHFLLSSSLPPSPSPLCKHPPRRTTRSPSLQVCTPRTYLVDTQRCATGPRCSSLFVCARGLASVFFSTIGSLGFTWKQHQEHVAEVRAARRGCLEG